MEGYERCYRDPASPLTPLPPFDANFCFDFEIKNAIHDDYTNNYGNNNFVQYSGTPLTSTTLLDSDNPLKPRFFSKNLSNFFETQDICPIKIIKTDHENHRSQFSFENIENIRHNSTSKVRRSSTLIDLKSQNYSKGKYLELPTRDNGKYKNSMWTLISNVQSPRKLPNKVKKTNNMCKGTSVNRILTKNIKECSPITHKSLSPRTAMVLTTSGLIKYKSLFQREEIDLMVFRMLTMTELEQLGIEDFGDRLRILEAVQRSKYIN